MGEMVRSVSNQTRDEGVAMEVEQAVWTLDVGHLVV